MVSKGGCKNGGVRMGSWAAAGSSLPVTVKFDSSRFAAYTPRIASVALPEHQSALRAICGFRSAVLGGSFCCECTSSPRKRVIIVALYPRGGARYARAVSHI